MNYNLLSNEIITKAGHGSTATCKAEIKRIRVQGQPKKKLEWLHLNIQAGVVVCAWSRR
jgi:hypothetical protein